MKNILYSAFCVLLCGCTTLIKSEPGAEMLIQLHDEPSGCQFLYKLESETSVYDSEDAVRYLENRIADQARKGNAYWITSQRTRPNEWVMFGPERAYILAANVYNCPDRNNITYGKSPKSLCDTFGKDSDYLYGNVY